MKARVRPMAPGQRKGRGKRCSVPIRIGQFVQPCGDRHFRAGRCAEHYADWKHAKEARARAPMTVTRVDPPHTNKKQGRRSAEIAKRRAAA